MSWAVRKSNLENVSSLVRRGAKVNKPERGGATPLLLAVHLNRPEIMTYLLNQGASVNLDDSYDTPLTVAVRKQHLEIVKVLVDSGAKINVVNIDGLSPLFWAIKQDDVKLLKLLTRKGIPKKAKDSSGDSPFIAAAKNGCSRETIQCLVKNGAHIHETALICAATKGQLVVIQVLVENGADGNMVGPDGNTLLATAVRYRQNPAARYLTSLGVNVCKVGKNGKTPLLWAIQNQDLDMIKWLLDRGAAYILDSVFLDAIATKNLEIVKILYDRGINKSQIVKTKGKTPLVQALDVESTEIVKFLLAKGDTLLDDLKGAEISYLLTFMEKKNYGMVKLLVDNGAGLDKFGGCGNTALTKAIELEDFEMIEYFVRCGANVNQANRNTLTPLVAAARVRDFRTFQFLVDSGAVIQVGSMLLDETLMRYYQIAQENIWKRKIADTGKVVLFEWVGGILFFRIGF